MDYHVFPRFLGKSGVHHREVVVRGTKVLRRSFPGEKTFRLMEDNDPSGYTSSKGMRAKDESSVATLDLPRYSPDLNPCDFPLWQEVERRMAAGAPKHTESATQYRTRLRKTAMGIPSSVVRKGVLSMKKRCQAMCEAQGADIACD